MYHTRHNGITLFKRTVLRKIPQIDFPSIPPVKDLFRHSYRNQVGTSQRIENHKKGRKEGEKTTAEFNTISFFLTKVLKHFYNDLISGP